LHDVHRSLGRIESRLDSQDEVLGELPEGHKVLVQLVADFHYHVEADKETAIQVQTLIARPLKRRKAVLKWIGGVAASVVVLLITLLFKGCGG
jgi:hypothetical protein